MTVSKRVNSGNRFHNLPEKKLCLIVCKPRFWTSATQVSKSKMKATENKQKNLLDNATEKICFACFHDEPKICRVRSTAVDKLHYSPNASFMHDFQQPSFFNRILKKLTASNARPTTPLYTDNATSKPTSLDCDISHICVSLRPYKLIQLLRRYRSITTECQLLFYKKVLGYSTA